MKAKTKKKQKEAVKKSNIDRFNLVYDQWIPIVNKNGENVKVSLNELFENIETVIALNGNFVLRVSILRFLICIVQDALNGPKNEDDWNKCKSKISSVVISYLKKYHSCFDLFGKTPFLQVPYLTKTNKHHRTFLNTFQSTGANHTLFDLDARIKAERTISLDEVVVNLLIKQSFTECGLKNKTAKEGEDITLWNNKKIDQHGKASALVGLLLTVIEGDNLLDTIHYNLITKEDLNYEFGTPIWRTDVSNQKNIKTNTYLYNLVPLSTAVLLNEDSDDITVCFGPRASVLKDMIKDGDDITLPYREPMATVAVSKKDKALYYKKVSGSKASWRELHSILQLSLKNIERGPKALNHIVDKKSKKIIHLSIGGFSFDKAKPISVYEWNYHIPLSLIQDEAVQLCEDLLSMAEDASHMLTTALNEYYERQSYTNMLQNYWLKMEECFSHVIDSINNDVLKEDVIKQWITDIRRNVFFSFDSLSLTKNAIYFEARKFFINMINKKFINKESSK